MSQPIFTISLVRELRGSPLTVLIAILLFEQSGQVPVTAQALKDATGYTDNTLTDSLRALTSPTRQIVIRVIGGWRLAGGFQLPLILESQNRIIRGFQATTTTARLEEIEGQPVEVVDLNSQNRKISGFSLEQKAIHKMLQDMRVGEPVCTELARSNDDPLFVLAHCIQAGYENIQTGLLIHRLRYRDVPEEKYRRMAQKKLDMYFS